ncbi:FecR domain-containing protein [Pedobacter sp. MC2016-14]|uniref:FecR family protein n=1 Tax=Pedobacter sp. MC2016-14 TaxID=2897327 RepID=UPI001E6238D8|nr:FecR family protein [Pedobacter sp. MC2016-14]MCD0490533.1 FecR domain-containing protein [Pedobacter sp. MC2016-14]
MTTEHLDQLIEKYILKTTSPQEQEELQAWFDAANDIEVFWAAESPDEEDLVKARMLNNIYRATQVVPSVPKVKLWPRFAAAASILLLVATGLYLFNMGYGSRYANHDGVFAQNDIPAGTKSATLTLSNGRKIALSNTSEGELAKQSGISITKTKDGQVVYSLLNSKQSDEAANFNTLSTARGETYSIKLSDGTLVTLNAASSLKFPANFARLKTRTVELTGEGYFSVKHDAKKPFFVKTSAQTVEDLGTEFNINAYPEEGDVKTTLVEGIAKVSIASSQQGATSQITLKPGQQTVIQHKNIKLQTADLSYTLAWKKGLFSFKDANIQTVMQQMARWYNFEVEYKGEIPKTLFTGEIHRDLNAAQVFKLLDFYQVDFEIRGHKILVTN